MKGKLVVRVIAFIAVALLLVLIGGIGFVYLAPETATHTFLAIERKQAGLERKEIDLPDGTHYVYLEGGSGEPLMLLHGFGANKDSFARASRYLTSRYRVIVPDHEAYCFAPESGVYRPFHALGASVEKGAPVGAIYSFDQPFRDPIVLKMGSGGELWSTRGPGYVSAGDPVAVVVREAKA